MVDPKLVSRLEKPADNGVLIYNFKFFSPFVFNLFDNKPSKAFAMNAFLCVFAGASVIDRTRTLDQGFRKCTVDPLPDLNEEAGNITSFSDLCDARAREIIEHAEQNSRPVHMFWSGGIDSTTALIALLRNMNNQQKRDYLRVFFNQASIDEYPWFYDQFIHNGVNKAEIGDAEQFRLEGATIVTGELGDQLYGSMIMEDLLGQYAEDSTINVLKADYKKVIPDLILSRLRTNDRNIAIQLLDYLEPLLQRSPYPVKSAFDFLWWLNFTLKWQHVDQRFSVGFRKDGSEVRKRYKAYTHFFKTVDFQKWSMLNPDKKIKDSWMSYKFPSKDYIYEFTRDSDYLKNKKKVPSTSLRKMQNIKYCFMLNDYNIIGAEDTLDIGHFRQKYKSSLDWIFE